MRRRNKRKRFSEVVNFGGFDIGEITGPNRTDLDADAFGADPERSELMRREGKGDG